MANPQCIWKVRLLIRLLLDVSKLNSCTYRYANSNQNNSPKCRKCNIHCEETVVHILFECPTSVSYRMKKWESVKQESLHNLINSMEQMSNVQKTYLMLNAFNAFYVKEWSVTYDAILDYVFSVYYNHINVCS